METKATHPLTLMSVGYSSLTADEASGECCSMSSRTTASKL